MANSMTEGADRQLLPDEHGEILRGPTPAAVALRTEVLEAWGHKVAGESQAMRTRSSIESRAELRVAATNEVAQDPQGVQGPPLVDRETAQQWADLDAGDFGRIRSTARREAALDAVAGHMQASSEYAEALRQRAPALADAGKVLLSEQAKQEKAAIQQTAAEQRNAQIDAFARSRETLIDAAAMAAVAATRARQVSQVVEQLAKEPQSSTPELREARAALDTAQRGSMPLEPGTEVPVVARKTMMRPVAEEELSHALTARYIVTQEKRGLFHKGATEFTLRSGQDQGKVAFVDAGKTLNTEREDKATIRAMVEVAVTKNWQELTVSGTDAFRRNAWLEASLEGLQVRGYEPREADRRMLDELREQQPRQSRQAAQEPHRRATNTIAAAERDLSPAKPSDKPAPAGRSTALASARHVDGDALSPQERTVLDNSRAILDAKAMGEQFTQAALQELEARLRGERVYVGEILDHGKAPYKFDKDNDDSYFVTLRTKSGDQVIWGKGLAEALTDRSAGEQIVLQNVGKRDVTVDARVRDAQGQVIGTRPKESHLNAWKSELLSRFSEKARSDFAARARPRQPSLQVYDPKAARAPGRQGSKEQDAQQARNVDHQRNGRER